jgi:hypothetical protein
VGASVCGLTDFKLLVVITGLQVQHCCESPSLLAGHGWSGVGCSLDDQLVCMSAYHAVFDTAAGRHLRCPQVSKDNDASGVF